MITKYISTVAQLNRPNLKNQAFLNYFEIPDTQYTVSSPKHGVAFGCEVRFPQARLKPPRRCGAPVAPLSMQSEVHAGK